MRILLVNNLYGADARGGAETVVAAEAAALATAGHAVLVVSGSAAKTATDGNPATRTYRPPQFFDYRDLGLYGNDIRFAWHVRDIFNGASARRFVGLAEGWRPDVVHTHNLMGLGFALPAAIRRRHWRHVHTVHDVQLMHPSGLIDPTAWSKAKSPTWFARAVYASLMRRRMGSPDVVIFPSNFLRVWHDQLGFFGHSEKIVVPNPAPPVAGAHREPEKSSFLFVGQLEKHKGVELLLDVWERWSPGRSARLVIAGSGPLEAAVRERAARAASDLRYVGRVDRAGLSAALAEASFVVLPSLVVENSPAVIAEAFAAGVPAVAAKTGGVPELVKEGETGFLFDIGDAAGFAAALDRAATVGNHYPEMSARVLDVAKGRSLECHVAALLGAYGSKS